MRYCTVVVHLVSEGDGSQRDSDLGSPCFRFGSHE